MALTRREIDTKKREKLRKEGRCLACGKKKDREGYYCTGCRDKNKERKKEDREFYRKNHICTACGKIRVFGSDRTCFECRAKDALRRTEFSEERKERNKLSSERSMKRIKEERIKNGLCPMCGKRKPEEGRKKCRICLNKDAEYNRMRRINTKNIREYRRINHLCYYCGKPAADGKNVCEECSQKMSEYSLRATKNTYWRQENKLIFKN